MKINGHDRATGSIVGLAIGDAIGTSVEFMEPGTFKPVTDMVGGGYFNLLPGQWTDDTSMALCLAESLIECNGMNLTNQLEKYVDWWLNGHNSSNGECFDIGNTTESALYNFIHTKKEYSGITADYACGNGSLMRLAPVPLFFVNDYYTAIEMSGESSKTTHANMLCVDACRYFAALILNTFKYNTKQEIFNNAYNENAEYWKTHPITNIKLLDIINCSFMNKMPPEINNSGYVIKTLESALWAFYTSDTFEDGLLKVVNLGDDADTAGAIYGQLAGAYYGINDIPYHWQLKLYDYNMIYNYAKLLIQNTK